MGQTLPFTMLTSGICSAYREGVSSLGQNSRVALIAEQEMENQAAANSLAGAALFATDAASFLEDGRLSAEVFGPSTLLVKYSSGEQLVEIARHLEGQLTATIHGTEEELKGLSVLRGILETKAGRLLFNGFPTGVEVGHAMVHGGPWPAASAGRSPSVGMRAIARFARPVCYQDFPQMNLPDELKDPNPLRIWRTVDGRLTQEGL